MVGISIERRYGLALLVGLATVAGCNQKADETPQGSFTPTVELISLPHGNFAARPGSPEQALANYLASDEGAPRTFRFDPTQFAPWSEQLSPQGRGRLATVILILKAYPHAKVTISAFADNVGSVSANQALSQERAESLQKLMVSRGISSSRIKAVGLGAHKPVANTDTQEAQALSRRIEITVTSK